MEAIEDDGVIETVREIGGDEWVVLRRIANALGSTSDADQDAVRAQLDRLVDEGRLDREQDQWEFDEGGEKTVLVRYRVA
jgi:hypothetical protein